MRQNNGPVLLFLGPSLLILSFFVPYLTLGSPQVLKVGFASFPAFGKFPASPKSSFGTSASSSGGGSSSSSKVSSTRIDPFDTAFSNVRASARPPVTYSLTFSYATVAPDNYIQSYGILINGVFPGPILRARPQDTIVVIVTNQLAHGISLHFHGIRNLASSEADGVPHVTQDKIVPGETFKYVVPIGSQSGTFIYHLHTGLDSVWAFGPLIVEDIDLLLEYPKSSYIYDYEYVFCLSQMWHNDTKELEKGLKGVPYKKLPEPSSILVNGKSFGLWPEDGKNALTKGYDTVSVVSGKIYRFRIIGFGTDSILSFSIANHTLTIIEVDGILVRPVEVDKLEVNSGQRYSILVKMDQEPDNYWVTSEMIPGPGPRNGKALIHYDKAPDPTSLRQIVYEGSTKLKEGEDELWEWTVDFIPNRKLQQPSVYKFPRKVDREIIIKSEEVELANGSVKYAINGNIFSNPKTPYLFQVRDDGVNITKEPQVYQSPKDKVIQMVFQNVANKDGECEQHPWHIHGHTFYIVGHGPGEYDPASDGPVISKALKGRGKKRTTLRDVVTVCPSVHEKTDMSNTGSMSSSKENSLNRTRRSISTVIHDEETLSKRHRRTPSVSSSSESTETHPSKSLQGDHSRHHSHRSKASDEGSGEDDNLMEMGDHSNMRHNVILKGLSPSVGCGWVAVRFVTDNPGVWLIHCHLTPHLIMGKQFVLYSYPKDNPRLIPPLN